MDKNDLVQFGLKQEDAEDHERLHARLKQKLLTTACRDNGIKMYVLMLCFQ